VAVTYLRRRYGHVKHISLYVAAFLGSFSFILFRMKCLFIAFAASQLLTQPVFSASPSDSTVAVLREIAKVKGVPFPAAGISERR
jgi:hypothetical protein